MPRSSEIRARRHGRRRARAGKIACHASTVDRGSVRRATGRRGPPRCLTGAELERRVQALAALAEAGVHALARIHRRDSSRPRCAKTIATAATRRRISRAARAMRPRGPGGRRPRELAALAARDEARAPVGAPVKRAASASERCAASRRVDAPVERREHAPRPRVDKRNTRMAEHRAGDLRRATPLSVKARLRARPSVRGSFRTLAMAPSNRYSPATWMACGVRTGIGRGAA
jgi:hypothetical protein